MPFVSIAQQRWGNSPAGRKALGGQAAVNEWNQATVSAGESRLPERVSPRRRLPVSHLMGKVHRVDMGRGKPGFDVKEGSLHRMLGIPEDDTIGQERLRKAEHSSNPVIRRKAISGIGLTHMHKG